MLDEMTSCAYSTVLDEVFSCEKSGFSRLFGTLHRHLNLSQGFIAFTEKQDEDTFNSLIIFYSVMIIKLRRRLNKVIQVEMGYKCCNMHVSLVLIALVCNSNRA